MYAQIEKPKENNSRVVANSVAQKKSNGKQGLGFVDNRPKSITQRKLLSGLQSNHKNVLKGNSQEVLQPYKNKSIDGNYKSISGMNLLGVNEAKINKRQSVGRFRAETLAENNSGTISNDIDTDLSNQENTETTRIGHKPIVSIYLSQYNRIYEGCMAFKKNIKKYDSMSVLQRGLVDAPLIKQGVSGYLSLAGQVDMIRHSLTVNIRPNINLMINNASDFGMDLETQLADIYNQLIKKQIIFSQTPAKIDHSSEYYMSNNGVAPAYNPHDTTKNAVDSELIDLNPAINKNLALGPAFGPVIRNIVQSQTFANAPIKSSDFAEPNVLTRAPLVGLGHTTAKGTGGYRGLSVWGKINRGKVKVTALAQHGTTNKKYVKVAAPLNIPGNWRLS